MIVTFQRKSKPSVKTIWQAIGKPASFTITGIEKTKQPWELPCWTIYYIKEARNETTK